MLNGMVIMAVVYITSNNGSLSEKDHVLFYEDYTGTRTKILPSKVSQINVIGRLTITSGAFAILFSNQIDVIFLNKNGKYSGKLVYSDKKNTILRHMQHEISSDKNRSASIAKDIVRGKLHNQYLFLQRIKRKNRDGSEKQLYCAIKEIGRIRSLLEEAHSIDEIRGYEGDAARLYFSCFGLNIECGWAFFCGRNKNPPLDPVNSVLSFLYTVLANRISYYVHENGLDAGIGTLHSITYGRESLVFDLIEEFRTPIVDTLTCSLFNLGVLNEDDFRIEADSSIDAEDELLEQNTGYPEAQAVLLNEGGMKKVLNQFEKKMESVHFYPLKNKALSYDKIVYEQVVHYKQVITGIMDHYLPMIFT